jgi:primosomal protein N' (replication factor Y)
MTIYLEIAVNVPGVTGTFHYHLPPELEGGVTSGHLVEVPFGRQRVQGVVLRQVSKPAVPETRAILDLIDPQVALTPLQLSLAERLAESTLAPLSACVNLMVPAGLSQMADTKYWLKEDHPNPQKNLSAIQRGLLDLLARRGPLRGRQINQALPHRNWRAGMRVLIRRDLVLSQSVLPPPSVGPKSVHTAQLACSPEKAEAEMPNLGRAGSKALARRQAMLRFLIKERGPVDVSWIYASSGGNLSDLRKIAQDGLVVLGENQAWRDPLEEMTYIPTQAPDLTHDQEAVWNEIQTGIHMAEKGKPLPPFLLHGVTGSGKTEIYLRAVDEVLKMGKGAFVLVPEIALTPQTVQRFLSRFPGQVGLNHSKLSPGERYDTWRRIRQGELKVVVGPRSALFAPLPNPGLIVVDESHDDSYYQSDSLPYYHARRAAVIYAQLARAICILGSATPDLVSWQSANQGKWHYLSLPARILAHHQSVQAQLKRLSLEQGATQTNAPERRMISHFKPLENQVEAMDLPPVQVIDMRQELKAGNRSIFSHPLQNALHEVLDKGLQAILFLNRRGTATYVFCRDCGYSLKCPRCDLPLTYHSAGHSSNRRTQPMLTCHHCGYQRRLPRNCPQCHSTRIRQYGTGTERVETEVHAMFPKVRTLRWDYETTRRKGAHEGILKQFSAHHSDVLIGTQMLAKGLDLPLVTLVGVVLADVGLNLPDYRAAERTFQVLTQVAGRAGRSPLGGKVILQTFQPEHYVIQAASKHDYKAFCRQELDYRKQLAYPPFTQLVRLEYRHTRASKAEAAAKELSGKINAWLSSQGDHSLQISGPVPCFFTRLNNQYRWQIILRGHDPAALIRDRVPADWRVEINPPSLL